MNDVELTMLMFKLMLWIYYCVGYSYLDADWFRFRKEK